MNELRIGDQIRYRGRVFRVRGFSPMSLPEQTVELADQQTGALAHVTLAQLRDLDPQDAAAGVRAARTPVELDRRKRRRPPHRGAEE